jgi:hypothetical protein
MLWAAVTGSGLLSAIYWTVPPLFADTEPVAARAIGPKPLVRTAALDRVSAPAVLPAVPMTPSVRAHRHSITLLETGLRRLKAVPGYTAEFSRQEIVGGALSEPETMQLKLRHAPFSVYLKWTEGRPGQELLYVDGENDGEMIVRPGGWKGRVLGPLKINPNGQLAQSESRHPITEIGLARLAEQILDYRYREAAWVGGFACTEDEAELDGRPCHRFTLFYDSPEVRPDYRKSVLYIDRELLVPTKVENYGWPVEGVAAAKIDEETLVETYSYTNIDLGTELAVIDFSAANENYGLRRR